MVGRWGFSGSEYTQAGAAGGGARPLPNAYPRQYFMGFLSKICEKMSTKSHFFARDLQALPKHTLYIILSRTYLHENFDLGGEMPDRDYSGGEPNLVEGGGGGTTRSAGPNITHRRSCRHQMISCSTRLMHNFKSVPVISRGLVAFTARDP